MSKESKGINLPTECAECKSKFIVGRLGSASIKSGAYNCDGEVIQLTYYDCPHCQHRHYVQVDDETSSKILQEVTRQFVALSVAKKRGKKIPRKQSNKFKNDRQKLADYRNDLMKDVSGKKAVDCYTLEETEELRFVVACLEI